MKHTLLAFSTLIGSALAELPQITSEDQKQWLGYFVGWEEKSYDFGIGSDGENILHIKKSGDRKTHKSFDIRYVVQEQINGKWTNRNFLKEEGLTSTTEKGVNPKKPVAVIATVTGDTKIEFLHAKSNGSMVVKPKLIEKKTENPIRVGLEIRMPRMYRIEKDIEKRALKKKVGGDYISGKRLKDGKKVKVKFINTDDDITGEKFLKEGASEIEVKSGAFIKRKLQVKQPSEKSGHIEVVADGPLYKRFKLIWWANSEKLGEKETFVTFSVE